MKLKKEKRKMKEIKTSNYIKLANGDVQTDPPINTEKDENIRHKNKGTKKKIYQKNKWVDDVSVSDLRTE